MTDTLQGGHSLGEVHTIFLNDLLNISDAHNYKLHLGCRNQDSVEPLDDYVANPLNWMGWNEWRGARNDWTRPRILSFMQFYPKSDAWLFGGGYEVVERLTNGYKLQTIPIWEKYVGRLIVLFHRYQGMRGRAFNLENLLSQFRVSELLPQIYTGESFRGFEKINHDFAVLEGIFHNERSDWKAALQSVKGIYLVLDKATGKKYVGSAYGDAGIWSRWASYIGTGHGWNDELVELINDKGITYAREHFSLSVLEVMTRSTPDDVIFSREAHWKRVLMTREYGYNKN
jgi:hypothetical protein